MARAELSGLWLGQRPYLDVLQLQQRCAALRRQGLLGDVLLLVEHPATITLGRGSKAGNLLASTDHLSKLGVEVHTINRGGDITLHAPGQLVGYPIVELQQGQRDVRRYVQCLTETMRRVATSLDVAAGPIDGYVGLWVDAAAPNRWQGAANATSLAKVGAIGVAISRWVTSHGFALNLTTDLSLFQLIVPCGISEHPTTSVQALTGASPSMIHCAEVAHRALAELLEREPLPFIDASEREWSEVVAELGP